MHLATGGIVIAVFVGIYLLALLYEGSRRRNRLINDHPFHSVYDPARGAARSGSVDYDEYTSSRSYARGTR